MIGPSRRCRKCGGFEMYGPRYESVGDCLRYRCAQCGYSETEPAKDRSESPLMRAARDLRRDA